MPLPSPNPVNSVKGQFLTASSQNNLLEHSHHPVNTIVVLSGLEFIPEMKRGTYLKDLYFKMNNKLVDITELVHISFV